MKTFSFGKRSGKTLCYEKELRHILENTNKRELIDNYIKKEKTIIEQEKELREIRKLLLDYEIQNTRLQEEVVRLRVNAGERVF